MFSKSTMFYSELDKERKYFCTLCDCNNETAIYVTCLTKLVKKRLEKLLLCF